MDQERAKGHVFAWSSIEMEVLEDFSGGPQVSLGKRCRICGGCGARSLRFTAMLKSPRSQNHRPPASWGSSRLTHNA